MRMPCDLYRTFEFIGACLDHGIHAQVELEKAFDIFVAYDWRTKGIYV